MNQSREPLTSKIDVTVPTAARMYDYYLGGKNNYAVDREAAEKLLEVVPSTQALALNNRRFLQRAVRVLARDYGIRQFIDHGSGLPTQDNVHQVAQRVDPDARVVYVDNDPIVLAHGRALLAENENTTVIQADMCDTDGVLDHPDTARLIDFDRPVAALFNSVFHCVPDSADPAGVVKRVADRLAPGSFFVICQLVSEDAGTRRSVTEFMDRSTGGNWGRVREPHEVERFFDGLEILEPGLVEVSTWRPDSDVGPRQRTWEWQEFGGVARMP
ncbi:SAM-dependent methyltransferase [Streptomyces verrucosisporus]|uniref:SAM-dependent methyltransferase n=1 Tax=Streptomyces verrucosisporus TaxID=1695161 RepID=UPI0019CF60EF|nr:SAM-dependent methyltransferase [Streptomyces verrucosisporus]MBN3930036.1 SAM-dependent methyltransferase [Streptomyces verrucosisporus]